MTTWVLFQKCKFMIAQKKWFVRFYSLLACFTLLIAGCSGGPPKPVVGEVTGKVTLGGAPFGDGRVVFKDLATSIEAVAELKSDGTFQLVTPDGGFRVGKCEVAVQPPPPAAVDPLESVKGGAAPADTSKIPQVYRDFATSGFKVTVAEGKNNFDLEMKPQ